MKTILQDLPCYVGGRVTVMDDDTEKKMSKPRYPVLKNLLLCYRHDTSKSVRVRALLDTGNDITIVKRQKVWELEGILGIDIYERRQILYEDQHNRIKFQPAYSLSLSLNKKDFFYSEYGFISPSPGSWNFGDFDVWIGQDLFNQLICTFDGVKGTVTIIKP